MNINKHVFLLGAGFSRNFGGFLGVDIKNRLFNRPILNGHKEIKSLFWAKGYEKLTYEDIYSAVMNKPQYSKTAKDALQTALMEVMEDQEGEFNKYGPTRAFAMEQLIELLCKINKQTYIFTLNHDLHFEKQWRVKYDIHIPGIFVDSSPNCVDIRRYQNKILPTVILPDQEILNKRGLGMPPDGGLYYIKLHGSMNFISPSDSDHKKIVMGHNKEEQLKSEPLLSAYHKLFDDVLYDGDIKLFVCGYSFGDKHINSKLLKARKDHNMHVYLLNPSSKNDIRDDALARAGLNMDEMIDHHFPYKIIDDLFPDGMQSNTGNWQEVKSIYRPDLV